MRQTVETFVGGVVVGALVVLTAGVLLGFQRSVPVAPAPVVAAAAKQRTFGQGCTTIWAEFDAAERSIPTHLQECVSRLTGAGFQRQTQIHQREMAAVIHRAIGSCAATYQPPATVAQR
jgi:hypothetical protein